MRRRIAAGNWKMNGTSQDLGEISAIAAAAAGAGCDVALCLPAPLLARAAMLGLPPTLILGGQDCHAEARGAFTGDVSAPMLADSGARCVIVGHSERRALHGETDAQVADKARAAWAAGLTAIICLGESEARYRAGETLTVLERQLAGSLPPEATSANTVLAYEPIWAIGTGLTPTTDEIGAVHAHLRAALPDRDIPILYGGSVNAGNAADIFAQADVDGALVGGASLKAATFLPIILALEAAS